MEKEMKYEAPVVEVIEVEVERGFAVSPTGIGGGMGGADTIGGNGSITGDGYN